MASAKTDKQNLQFILQTMELPSLNEAGVTKHLATLELVWPRTGIAKRTSVLTLPFVNGLCATDVWSLANKLCFKETCEGQFGLRIAVSESVTATKVRNFMRYMLGKTADVAGDALEDAVAVPVLDELAALPMYYLSKQLLGTSDPELIAEGCVDLASAQFSASPSEVTVPLMITTETIRRERHGKTVKTIKSLVRSEGKAVFSVQAY